MNERWNDDRLDRLASMVAANEELIAANTRSIEQLSVKTDANATAIEALTVKVDANLSAIAQLTAIATDQQQTIGAISQGFELLVQEIRGLRAENRRILEHLFGTDA